MTLSDEGDFEIEYFSAGSSTGTEDLTAAEYEAAYGDFDTVWELYGPGYIMSPEIA